MEGADESTELWRNLARVIFYYCKLGATIVQWLRLQLPSSGPGFESQLNTISILALTVKMVQI